MSKDAAERLRELVAHEVERQGELEGIRRNESFLKDVLANWLRFLIRLNSWKASRRSSNCWRTASEKQCAISQPLSGMLR
ncbi:Uncharacterised protein [Escherichia coli]|uniref:Uncharacterized protein n=1 Tax=Escherichia coli TaxID=562 RepID=A0A376TLR5_ECOLX|nr:Uncharacterised protein [Escherichia coli]